MLLGAVLLTNFNKMKTVEDIKREIRLNETKTATVKLLSQITKEDRINTGIICKLCGVDSVIAWPVIVSLVTGRQIYETEDGNYRLS